MEVNAVDFKNLCGIIEQNINKIMIGKNQVIHMILVALAAGGHVLIEDVPGIGKTTLVSALADSLNLSFKRIQFTPDLMPTDVTGFSIYNNRTERFEFQEGAVMSQIVLADEINRTSPKTQSALLEVMQEHQVTVDGKTYKLPQPFIVLATQNPVEQLGTYPLPEAQLDRFMLKINLGYPTIREEVEILNLYSASKPLPKLESVADAGHIMWMKEQVQLVYCAPSVKAYIVALCNATRSHEAVVLGASPRASMMLMQAARAYALLQGRGFVRPDDVQALAVNVLAHRLTLRPESKLRQITAESVIQDVVKSVRVPEK